MNTEELFSLHQKLEDLSIQIGELHKEITRKQKHSFRSEEINELATALAKAQGEIQIAGKTETNPFFKSRYADLAEIVKVSRPYLSKNGLSVVQNLVTDDEGITMLHTMLFHSSGQWIESRVRIIPPKNDVQSFGSTITYNRRYAYASLINIAVADEDDDGEASVFDTRQVMAKGTALNTKYNPKESTPETITKEQREELEYELTNYPDIAEMIMEGFKIRSIADMPKTKFIAAINRVREIKLVREGK